MGTLRESLGGSGDAAVGRAYAVRGRASGPDEAVSARPFERPAPRAAAPRAESAARAPVPATRQPRRHSFADVRVDRPSRTPGDHPPDRRHPVQRQDDEAAVEPAPAGSGRPALVVEDGTADLAAGQIARTAFLAALREAVERAAADVLEGTGQTVEDCPYVQYWFAYYDGKDAAHVERAVRRYTGVATGVAAWRDYLPLVADRVRDGFRAAVEMGRLTEIPDEVPRDLVDPESLPANAPAPAASGGARAEDVVQRCGNKQLREQARREERERLWLDRNMTEVGYETLQRCDLLGEEFQAGDMLRLKLAINVLKVTGGSEDLATLRLDQGFLDSVQEKVDAEQFGSIVADIIFREQRLEDEDYYETRDELCKSKTVARSMVGDDPQTAKRDAAGKIRREKFLAAREVHERDRAALRGFIEDGLEEDDVRTRNSCEWMTGGTGNRRLYAVSPTHDTGARARRANKGGELALFGKPRDPMFANGTYRDATTFYNYNDVTDNDNVEFASEAVSGTMESDGIYVAQPARKQRAKIWEVLRHEVQHAADYNPVAFLGNQLREREDLKGDEPEVGDLAFEMFKTEYRAYTREGGTYASGRYANASDKDFDGRTMSARKADILDHLYGSGEYKIIAGAWDANLRLTDGRKFQDAVVAFGGESINPRNSVRIDDFHAALRKLDKSVTDLEDEGAVALAAAARRLGPEERWVVRSYAVDDIDRHLSGQVKSSVTGILDTGAREPPDREKQIFG